MLFCQFCGCIYCFQGTFLLESNYRKKMAPWKQCVSFAHLGFLKMYLRVTDEALLAETL